MVRQFQLNATLDWIAGKGSVSYPCNLHWLNRKILFRLTTIVEHYKPLLVSYVNHTTV